MFTCVVVLLYGHFLFQQKTAYERRISDWSSDVRASDLSDDGQRGEREVKQPRCQQPARLHGEEQPIVLHGRRIGRAGRRDRHRLAAAVCADRRTQRLRGVERDRVERGIILLAPRAGLEPDLRSEEHTSELQSLMRISYAVFCLQKKHYPTPSTSHTASPI